MFVIIKFLWIIKLKLVRNMVVMYYTTLVEIITFDSDLLSFTKRTDFNLLSENLGTKKLVYTTDILCSQVIFVNY